MMESTPNLPPNAIEAEEALLGGLLLEQSMIDKLISGSIHLQAEHFFHTPNATIFGLLCRMRDEGRTVDVITATEELKAAGAYDKVGGSRYLTRLFERVGDPGSIPHYAELIVGAFRRRQLERLCLQALRSIKDEQKPGDTEVIRAELESGLIALNTSNGIETPSIGTHLDKYMADYRAYQKRVQAAGHWIPKGITTGLSALDRKTHGLIPGELVILAARPSMGKTSLATQIVTSAALSGKAGVIFSMEMDGPSLVGRMLMSGRELPASKVWEAEATHEEFVAAATARIKPVMHLMHINEIAGIGELKVRAICRQRQSEGKLDWVMLDYLQLMNSDGGDRFANRNLEIGRITGSLKKLARELNVPVLLISQLRRPSNEKANWKPQLSELRDSGAIEQDADQVWFIWRKEFKDKGRNDEPASLDEFRAGIPCWVTVEKNRNGPTGDIPLEFVKAQTRFTVRKKGSGGMQSHNKPREAKQGRLKSFDKWEKEQNF